MSEWGVTPRQSVTAACERLGRCVVVRACRDLLSGADVAPELVEVLAGPASDWVLTSGPENAYWLRVWGARGLLWAWDDEATPEVLDALADPAWRVREMAAKVVARHRVDAALGGVLHARADAVPRVRVAAERAARSLATGPAG